MIILPEMDNLPEDISIANPEFGVIAKLLAETHGLPYSNSFQEFVTHSGKNTEQLLFEAVKNGDQKVLDEILNYIELSDYSRK